MLPKNVPRDKLPITIAHISDFHIGSYYFVENLMETAVEELNQLKPDKIVVTGDLTSEGFREEYRRVRAYLDRLECRDLVVVPGNHDSRHVGYLHFEDLIGPRHGVHKQHGVTIVATDSTEPDLDSGRIGRERYRWLHESFSDPDDFKIFVLHHHLLPVPGTGRERNIVYDAGDVLQVLLEVNVDLVLTGHKHVPYVWRLENFFIVNAGTISSLRLRGRTRPCYNIIQIELDRIRIFRKYPSAGKELIIDFSEGEKNYCKWTARVDQELMSGGDL